MNNVIARIQSTGKVLAPDGEGYEAFPTSMSRSEGEAVYEMVKGMGARRTLEVGFAYGMSTMHICEALRGRNGALHVVIDPFQSSTWHNIGLLNLERAGLRSLVEFHEASSDKVLPQLHARHLEFDFALIDGAHLFDYAFVDFFYVDKMLRLGAVVCMDDLWMPAMQKVCRYYVRNRGYQIVRGVIPRPVHARIRELAKAALGAATTAALRRAVRRTRESGTATTPLLFLRKLCDVPSVDRRDHHMADF